MGCYFYFDWTNHSQDICILIFFCMSNQGFEIILLRMEQVMDERGHGYILRICQRDILVKFFITNSLFIIKVCYNSCNVYNFVTIQKTIVNCKYFENGLSINRNEKGIPFLLKNYQSLTTFTKNLWNGPSKKFIA